MVKLFKKLATTIFTFSLVLMSLTACDSSEPDSQETSHAAESTAISLPESTTSPESPVIESTVSMPENPPVEKEKTVGIYGETEIPDIHIRSSGEGTAITYEESDQLALEESLDSMIFETHPFGEYTVRLVGDKVRTDNEYFPGVIYVQNPRAEFEKDGTIIEECEAAYTEYNIFMAMFAREFTLIPDKIGTYLDWYELECPVLAMKYYYPDDPETTVKQVLEFRPLRDGKIERLWARSDKGIGVRNGDYDDTKGHMNFKLVDEDGGGFTLSTFSADRFAIADSNTLIDEEAGVKYTFDFEECFKPNSPNVGYLYTAKWIS